MHDRRRSRNVYEGISFGMINITDRNSLDGPRNSIYLLTRRNLLLLVDIADTNNSTFALFSTLIHDDKRLLENYAFHIYSYDEPPKSGHLPRNLTSQLFNMPHKIMNQLYGMYQSQLDYKLNTVMKLFMWPGTTGAQTMYAPATISESF